MNTRLLAIAMLLCTFAAKAQYVNIPDTAFALFLQQTYPNCMNSNQMDTTCSEIVNETTVNCSHAGIADLDGIQYFDKLTYLYCNNNKLTNVQLLPKRLRWLECQYNLIAAISQLPDTLVRFYCDSNKITSLPTLPNLLSTLYCNNNQLLQLPTLPNNLRELECSNNQITNLPALPINLHTLKCYRNLLTTLPVLPPAINWLECSHNQLTAFPSLPDTMFWLGLSSNQISFIPSFPTSLMHIYVSYNGLSSLPTLPTNLINLECHNNALSTLPALPSSLLFLNFKRNNFNIIPTLPIGLQTLDCGYNPIDSLPTLPTQLYALTCDSNNLTHLPTLPTGLQHLDCSGNKITSIPALPLTFRSLICGYNSQLNYLPELPDTMEYIGAWNTPLLCLPRIKYIEQLYLDPYFVGCVPNYGTVLYSDPLIDTFPICQPGNTNGCVSYTNISGKTYHDKNSNCTFDNIDLGQYGLKHSSYNNGILVEQVYSNSAGNYSFDVTAYDNYETRLDTTGLPFTIACPNGGAYYDTLTANDSAHFNRNFALKCETGFDLTAHSIASGMIFRPANNTVVDIHAGDLANFYQASCIQGVSGTVTVTLHGPISYIAPANGAITPSNVINNILTWNVADFGTANALTDFNIIIQTDTFAQSGQQACFDVMVTPLAGDNDTSNNHLYYCFNIVNSYDPNDKTAYPAGDIDTMQEWITYTIRFQNTGDAEAQHIYIMDTLDTDVQVSTFQLLSYSHQPVVQINESILRFNFYNINLPDTFTNEPGSHGYVQYKVKLKEDLAIGTAINNTAYIYFDYNTPVVTNTATNTIAVEEDTVEVGIKSISKSFDLLVYPNPANQQVTIVSSEQNKTVTIYNMEGRMVLTHNIVGTAATLNIAQLPSGVYTIGINGTNLRKRFVKL